MYYTKDRKTGQLFDQWRYLGPKRRKLLNESWAGLFRETILPELPVERMAPFFSPDLGRPTKELYAMLGAILFQQIFDLTDEETVSQMAFNLQWHYALDNPEESDRVKYISPKTLWSMRNILTDQDLDTVLFEKITDTLAKVFDVDTSKQRIDSVHIKSNMRRLGRIGILVRCLHKFLVNLKRQYKELFETLPQELVEKYLSEKVVSCFSLVKPSETERTLASVSEDLFQVVQHFMDDPEVKAMYSYSLLLRVLHEQCRVKETADGQLVEIAVKPSEEIPSDSLQNPSDPDAGYSGHKGQGYQVQIMETYHPEAEEEALTPKLKLITHVHVESAHQSDAHALIPALEATKERELAPGELLADSLYGSDDNCERAQEMGVDVISPAMGTPKENTLSLSDFQQSEKGIITACPQGHAPVKIRTGKKQKHGVAFSSEHCIVCPCKDLCPVKAGKKNHYLHYDLKTMRIANRRAMEYSPEFKDKYRWRSGIEGTFSEMDKKTGVKRLRVRGLSAVAYFARLKAVAVNIFRATAVRKALDLSGEAFAAAKSHILYTIIVFKEQFLKHEEQLTKIFTSATDEPLYELKIAA